MTLLDRYLHAIRTALPKDQPSDDIVAEIADDLQSQFDERESAVGRTLSEDEQCEIIKAYGHPRSIAARYSKVQYLIGPQLLPFYWSTLTLIVTAIVAIELLAGGISAVATHNGLRFFDAMDAAFHSLPWIFTFVTIAFALGERAQGTDGRSFAAGISRWDPRKLPAPSAQPPVQRGSALVEFIANFIMLLVVLDAPGPHRIPLDAIAAGVLRDMHIILTPAWHGTYVGLAIATALLAASAIATFIQPRLAAMHEFVRALASAVTIIGFALTLQAGPLIEPASPLNTIFVYALGASIAIAAMQIAWSIRVLVRTPRLA